MNPKLESVIARMEARFPGTVTRTQTSDQPTFMVTREAALAVFEHLKSAEGFSLLLDVLAVDFFPARPRFELVYHLYHPIDSLRLRLKVKVGQDQPMFSVVGIWPGANWPEREAYDLYGVVFEGHPNLTRIYLPDDWDGHPLRKDYPTTGKRTD